MLCESASNVTPISVMGALGAVALAVLALRRRGVRLDALSQRLSVLTHVDKGTLKILWSTAQIISSVSWNLSISFPPPCEY